MTPFEIRLSLLNLAKDLAMDKFYTTRDATNAVWDVSAENARKVGATVPTPPSPPDFPTQEEIVKTATFLSEFINRTK